MKNNKTKELFESLVKEGKSITDISKIYQMSHSNTRYWLKKFGLKTNPLTYLENRIKITDEELRNMWFQSDSINSFLKKLGLNSTGGSWYHYRKRLKTIGIEPVKNSLDGKKRGGKTTAKLKNNTSLLKKERKPRHVLKKLLELNSVEYKCNVCSINKWNGKQLLLHIHHRDHNKTNNIIENLEYICPNCHSQEHYTTLDGIGGCAAD